MGALKVRNYIRVNEEQPVLFDSLDQDEKKKLGMMLNAQALKAVGYTPSDKNEYTAALRKYKEAEKLAL